jgi:hypothetical protein
MQGDVGSKTICEDMNIFFEDGIWDLAFVERKHSLVEVGSQELRGSDK